MWRDSNRPMVSTRSASVRTARMRPASLIGLLHAKQHTAGDQRWRQNDQAQPSRPTSPDRPDVERQRTKSEQSVAEIELPEHPEKDVERFMGNPLTIAAEQHPPMEATVESEKPPRGQAKR